MMSGEVKVSVTVPVYNTSEYLDKCVDSLVNQTLREIEIILVDDGSTDGSGELCDKWAERDNRINVVHRPNGGSAVARQVGLESSKGEYVIVCDSDDWVETDAYEKAYGKALADNADMVFFGYYADYPDGSERKWIRRYSDPDDIEAVREEIMRTSAYTSWNKLTRRCVFTDNGISYEPGLNMGEDALILHKLLNVRPLKISVLPLALYHYRQREGGYTHAMKAESVLQLCRIHEWTKQNLDIEIHGKTIENNAVNIAFESLRCRKFPKKVFADLLGEIKNSALYSSPRSPQKLTVLVSKIFGWSVGRMFYKHIYLRFLSR